ncbi:DNA polymerase III subunit psi [Vibrio sp. 10N.286.49.B3]|uniref:DNA polymerase III subunit psi n=1 Tax=Vibrio sp. 10N.286.49.B3 TaxID=1880855 RepID=UPI000C850EEC|nr:DNA polymerase III subunit psi [Vibrio sp. 10N.286.49.B3]PMH41183.1 DNA polymerase III subunit psi [Vibrio sp. 10N.286.49.B3]
MPSTTEQYLQEMGIARWDLIHPERLSGYVTKPIELPASCQLLFISPVSPEGELALMFERVLKSMKLTLEQALYITPEQLANCQLSEVKWLWFAGCENSIETSHQCLNTPLLSDIEGNNQQRRALWQQICAYD